MVNTIKLLSSHLNGAQTYFCSLTTSVVSYLSVAEDEACFYQKEILSAVFIIRILYNFMTLKSSSISTAQGHLILLMFSKLHVCLFATCICYDSVHY